MTLVLENLALRNQLVYTTHSPFMINRDDPQRVRVITKNDKGTQMDAEAYQENWKPLRRSIGLTVGDLFFFNNSSFVIELPKKKSIKFGSRDTKKQPK